MNPLYELHVILTIGKIDRIAKNQVTSTKLGLDFMMSLCTTTIIQVLVGEWGLVEV